MISVCWRSLTPFGDGRSGCWGDKHVLSMSLWACFYLSEPTLLPLLLSRRLFLLMMIPEGPVFTVIWHLVEAFLRVVQAWAISILFGCWSMTLSRWYRKPWATQCWELWDGLCQLVPSWSHSAPAHLSQGCARQRGDALRSAWRWTFPWSWPSLVAWGSPSLLWWEGWKGGRAEVSFPFLVPWRVYYLIRYKGC